MTKRGFTLVETIVYLALFSLIIGGLTATAFMLFETSDRNQTKAMMQEEENYIFAKIVRTFNNTSSVTLVGNTLTLTKYDASVAIIDTVGTDVRLNGSVLNNANVAVTNLSFVHTGSASTPESVEVGLTVSAKTPTGSTVTESASTTSYIRK